jgi:hypothetical protein
VGFELEDQDVEAGQTFTFKVKLPTDPDPVYSYLATNIGVTNNAAIAAACKLSGWTADISVPESYTDTVTGDAITADAFYSTVYSAIDSVKRKIQSYVAADKDLYICMEQLTYDSKTGDYTLQLGDGDFVAPTATADGSLSVRVLLMDGANIDFGEDPDSVSADKIAAWKTNTTACKEYTYTLAIPATGLTKAEVLAALQKALTPGSDWYTANAKNSMDEVRFQISLTKEVLGENGSPNFTITVENFNVEKASLTEEGTITCTVYLKSLIGDF